MNSEHAVVLVTAPVGEAAQLARALVDKRLAACVNVLPGVRSIYTWKGEVCDDEESLLVIKTSQQRLEDLRGAVIELHSYDVPEVIALPIVDGHPDYLRWVSENTRR